LELKSKHLLGIETLEPSEIRLILQTADSFLEISTREIKKVPTLRGKTIVNLFYEASTRTRSSFELAGRRLSADILNFSKQTSSVAKGETLRDTILTLEAMRPDAVIIRHSSSGSAYYLTTFCRSHVINAGDGLHEHPTQALLDAYTIKQEKKSFKDLKVVLCGDILHSRVARSNLYCLKKLGADLTLCGPPTLLPAAFADFGARIQYDFDKALDGADVVMMLRLQLERMQKSFFPSVREYHQLYGLTAARVARAAKDAIVMHPGPINRGVEIAPEVADSAQSLILRQVENGVAIRMAVLYLLLGGKESESLG
jgi:aspartate carbamoyltransferase catalytic subunit